MEEEIQEYQVIILLRRNMDWLFGSGGGATDIRKIKASEGSWYDLEHESWKEDKSLQSRIIVAGGGRTEGLA